MRKHTLLLPVVGVVAAITLGACGSGGKSSGSASAMTPQRMAAKIGCPYTPNDQPELYVAQEGDCTVAGHDVTLYTFSSAAGQNNWTNAAKNFGLGPHVTGKLWVATVDDAGVAATVQHDLGGTLG